MGGNVQIAFILIISFLPINFAACPFSYQQYKDSCFRISLEKNSYEFAKAECSQNTNQGQLANFFDEATQAFITGWTQQSHAYDFSSGNDSTLADTSERFWIESLDKNTDCSVLKVDVSKELGVSWGPESGTSDSDVCQTPQLSICQGKVEESSTDDKSFPDSTVAEVATPTDESTSLSDATIENSQENTENGIQVPVVPEPTVSTNSGCEDLAGWKDSMDYTCTEYAEKSFCTSENNYGAGWEASWGPFAVYAVNGIDATKACCLCGRSAEQAPNQSNPDEIGPEQELLTVDEKKEFMEKLKLALSLSVNTPLGLDEADASDKDVPEGIMNGWKEKVSLALALSQKENDSFERPRKESGAEELESLGPGPRWGDVVRHALSLSERESPGDVEAVSPGGRIPKAEENTNAAGMGTKVVMPTSRNKETQRQQKLTELLEEFANEEIVKEWQKKGTLVLALSERSSNDDLADISGLEHDGLQTDDEKARHEWEDKVGRAMAFAEKEALAERVTTTVVLSEIEAATRAEASGIVPKTKTRPSKESFVAEVQTIVKPTAEQLIVAEKPEHKESLIAEVQTIVKPAAQQLAAMLPPKPIASSPDVEPVSSSTSVPPKSTRPPKLTTSEQKETSSSTEELSKEELQRRQDEMRLAGMLIENAPQLATIDEVDIPVPGPAEPLPCYESPQGWRDANSYTCKFYSVMNWCTPLGRPGTGWDIKRGTIKSFAVDGVDAMQACCACGGGVREDREHTTAEEEKFRVEVNKLNREILKEAEYQKSQEMIRMTLALSAIPPAAKRDWEVPGNDWVTAAEGPGNHEQIISKLKERLEEEKKWRDQNEAEIANALSSTFINLNVAEGNKDEEMQFQKEVQRLQSELQKEKTYKEIVDRMQLTLSLTERAEDDQDTEEDWVSMDFGNSTASHEEILKNLKEKLEREKKAREREEAEIAKVVGSVLDDLDKETSGSPLEELNTEQPKNNEPDKMENEESDFAAEAMLSSLLTTNSVPLSLRPQNIVSGYAFFSGVSLLALIFIYRARRSLPRNIEYIQV